MAKTKTSILASKKVAKQLLEKWEELSDHEKSKMLANTVRETEILLATVPDIEPYIKDNALFHASSSGKSKIVKMLVEAGANINSNKGVALSMAAIKG